MTAFPDFDLHFAGLEDESMENGDCDTSSAISSTASALNPRPTSTSPSKSNNSTPSRRKRARKDTFHIDSLSSAGGNEDDIIGLINSGVLGAMEKLPATADGEEISVNTNVDNGTYSRFSLEEPASPNKLVVADELLTPDCGDAYADGANESTSNPQVNTPPPSPDGITSEDRSVARCDACDIEFVTKRQRSEHLRDVHGVDKPFKCEYCRARFPYSSSLYNHVRIHSENKPFKCSQCDAAFRWKNSLRHHRLHVHKEEPTSVQIAAKCVLEGKKPAPTLRPPNSTDSSALPRKTSRSTPQSKRAKNGTLSPPFEIDVAKVIEEAERLFTHSELSADLSSEQTGTSGAFSTSFSNPTTKIDNSQQRRKRKPKSTFRVADAATSDNGLGHTCGHCEKQFSIWADLVQHLGECAEREKSILSDDAAPDWVSADEQDGSGRRDSEVDSDGPSGLIIDQCDGDGIFGDQGFIGDSVHLNSDSANTDGIGTINGIALFNDINSGDSSPNEDDDLLRRVQELERRMDEMSSTYDARIGALEATVSELKSQLVRQE